MKIRNITIGVAAGLLLLVLFGAVTTPISAITDGGVGDTNTASGIVGGTELVKISTTSAITLDILGGTQIDTLDINGLADITTAKTLASGMTATTNTVVTAGTGLIVKSNNPDGYTLTVQMCNATTSGAYLAVPGCNNSQNLVNAASLTFLAPASNATLTGAGTATGGEWGYEKYAVGGSAVGSYSAVPAFGSAIALISPTGVAGFTGVNVSYGARTTYALDGGLDYANYVLYTASVTLNP
ncbi:hypothetical protein FWC31_03285 [Candidatus Saccharibacteria bacterium]|nr:hypothetical protein [Candidatus Saccharibacteria bacterium]